MAKFKLNPGAQPVMQGPSTDHVRIGAISVFALVALICLSVLAVLALSTANASLTMSQRQAVAMQELYLAETSAQEFLAGVDAVLAESREEANQSDGTGVIFSTPESTGAMTVAQDEQGNALFDENKVKVVVEDGEDASSAGEAAAKVVNAQLKRICNQARDTVDGKVQVMASVVGNKLYGEFSCENGRVLNIIVTVRNNATYRIDKWKMSAVQNEEEPQGQLLIID